MAEYVRRWFGFVKTIVDHHQTVKATDFVAHTQADRHEVVEKGLDFDPIGARCLCHKSSPATSFNDSHHESDMRLVTEKK